MTGHDKRPALLASGTAVSTAAEDEKFKETFVNNWFCRGVSVKAQQTAIMGAPGPE